VTGVEHVQNCALPVVIERWKRYGHDRAYVRVDGEQVGYRDLKTGTVQCRDAGLVDTIVRATDHLLPTEPAEPVAEVTHPEPAAPTYAARHALSDAADPPGRPAAVPPLLPDRDLALNRPGASARAQAIAQRDAAPVRTFFARAIGAKTDERNWRIGADAEVQVGRRLLKLPDGWQVLHAVPVGENGSDIDHIVIGPGGVFTINTKHHPDTNVWVFRDTIKVNGHNQPYVRNSRHEARRAARLLTAKACFDVDVRGLIAVMGAHRGFTVKEQPVDGTVVVVTRKTVTSYLKSMPAVLGAPSVDRIYGVARHLATWQPSTVGWSEF
jgi:hypothetical protein